MLGRSLGIVLHNSKCRVASNLVYYPNRFVKHSNVPKKVYPKVRPISRDPLDWPIVQGDIVQVMKGKYKNKRGRVLRVYRADLTLLVQGVNIGYVIKLNERQEEIEFTEEKPINYNDVKLIDPTIDKAVNIKWLFNEFGDRIRVSVKTDTIIPKLDRKEQCKRPEYLSSELDTKSDIVRKKTYKGEDFNIVFEEFKEFILRKHNLEEAMSPFQNSLNENNEEIEGTKI